MSKKRKSGRVIVRIVTFVLALFIFALTLIVTAQYSVLSGSAIEKAFRQVDYAKGAYEDAYLQIESLTLKNGLPVQVFEDAVTYEQTVIFVNMYKDSITQDGTQSLLMDNVRGKIIANTNRYLSERKTKITDEIEKNIEIYADKAIEIYKLSISNTVLEHILEYSSHMETITMIFVPAGIAGIAVCTWILYKNSRRKHQLFRRYATSFGTASLMLIIVPAIFYFLKSYSKVSGIATYYRYELVTAFLKMGIVSCIFSGLVLFFAMLVCIALWLIMIYRKKK